MRPLLASIGLIVATMLGAYPALARDTYSAKFVMPGCRDFLGAKTLDPFSRGLCFGLIVGATKNAALKMCPPRSLTNEQVVMAIVQYIDSQPARLQEDFIDLATEALNRTWPCRN